MGYRRLLRHGLEIGRVVDGPTAKLVSQKTAPVRVTKVIKPVKITEPKPGVFVFDMGQNIAGWGRLTGRGPAGTTSPSSTMSGSTRMDRSTRPTPALVYSGKFQTDTYILKGEGMEVWEPRFVYSRVPVCCRWRASPASRRWTAFARAWSTPISTTTASSSARTSC